MVVPIERQSRAIQELACRQFGRMLSAEDCADNVRGQQRETEQRAVLRLADYSPMVISVDSATVMSGFGRVLLD